MIGESKEMFFISGVSGVGKTAAMANLKTILPSHFEVHDFDERGVPDNAGHDWRLRETHHWIGKGQEKAKVGTTLVVCGFANPDEIEPMQSDFPGIEVKTILLDADAPVIENRLRGRNANASVAADLARAVGNAEAFIQNNTKFVSILRDICQRYKCPIIDTTNLSPEAVAQEIVKIIVRT